MKFKYLTLNIWDGGALWDKILAFLKKEDPDILTIQEAYNSKDKSLPKNYRTIEELKKVLKGYFVFFSPEYLSVIEHGKIDIGNAIFSRFPIIENSVLFFDKPYGEYHLTHSSLFSLAPVNIQHAKIEANGVILNVFNTHGIWGYDGLDNPRRLMMSQKIVDQIKKKENVILSGDFNVNQDTKSIENIEKHLLNVFKGELVSSFNMKRKPKESGYSTAVVDNIFISPNIQVLEHYCPQIDVSDHLPLVAILEV